MGSYALEASNVTKYFPGVKALDKAKIQIDKGEIHGLIGENGAGKSTLLKIMNGLIPYSAYDGDLFVNGKSVVLHSPHDAQVKGIGYVPQEINVMNELTVAENIFVGYLSEAIGKKRFVSLRLLEKKAKDFLDNIHIELQPSMRVGLLSTAQKQMLMIARALSQDAPILILDEPTTALTYEEVLRLFTILRELREAGKAIIFVTHKLQEIISLTDKVTIFRDGCYVSTYQKKDYDEKKIVADMVGRKIENLYPKRNVKISDEVLRVEGLYVEHPRIMGKYVVENVSFSLHKGEVLGLAGLVGSGRTETLRALYGAIKKSGGRIFLNGKKSRVNSEAEALKKGLGFLTEDRKKDGLLILNNIAKNISINDLAGIKKYGLLSKRLEAQRAQKPFDTMRIKAPGIESMVVSLSGGNQQKILAARALNSKPRIMLLDEPTKGIDVGSKNEIYNIINDLAAQGIAVIMVSSELPELIAMCDRFIVLADGRMVAEIDKSEATQESIMTACFNG
ncbi:MAG: sugar ABC transporter ATP-binding protein [Eubacteriales bacterium]|nr:sugar ABC transporter ATP-binding protein [Eubacteriales bacterium]